MNILNTVGLGRLCKYLPQLAVRLDIISLGRFNQIVQIFVLARGLRIAIRRIERQSGNPVIISTMKYAISFLLIATLAVPAIAGLSLAERGRSFLEQNQHKEGVIVTKSGLQYKILAPGNSKKPTSRSRVTINYQGKHIDNVAFDSTFNDEPSVLSLRRAIKGWKEGLPLIGEGGRIVLFVPSRLAYGRDGAPPSIKRNETLIFIIDLLEVHD